MFYLQNGTYQNKNLQKRRAVQQYYNVFKEKKYTDGVQFALQRPAIHTRVYPNAAVQKQWRREPS